jgi:hypothetical protein
MATLSNYIENKVIDWLFRGQSYSPPATLYVALFTATPSAAGGGTEVSGGSYARVAITSSLANWAGTQGATTTVASSGTSGLTSNNGVVTFPGPTAGWGTITSVGIFDASTSGNLICFGNLSANKTISSGDPAPLFPISAITFQAT